MNLTFNTHIPSYVQLDDFHKLNIDRYKRNVKWVVLEGIVNFNQYICHRTS